MSSSSEAKKKQIELRKYMQEFRQKKKPQSQIPSKIDSPIAKYDEKGNLTCILCKKPLKNESVWTIHITSKQHRENVEAAKQLKEKTKNFTVPIKRHLAPPIEVPEKKPKSILKNGKQNHSSATSEPEKAELPPDFFDETDNKKSSKSSEKSEVENMETSVQKDPNEILPEGFFDDPKLDAKARHQEYRDPIEEEWEKFQKEIRDAEGESAAIIAGDQEESTTERQIDEIDEQMKKLSRVLALEKKKVEVIAIVSDHKDMEVEENDEELDDIDEFLDWRCKNSLK